VTKKYSSGTNCSSSGPGPMTRAFAPHATIEGANREAQTNLAGPALPKTA